MNATLGEVIDTKSGETGKHVQRGGRTGQTSGREYPKVSPVKAFLLKPVYVRWQMYLMPSDPRGFTRMGSPWMLPWKL